MMGTLFATIQALATGGSVRVSAHGFEEFASDDISLAEILDGLNAAISIEEYPDYHKARAYSFCRP